MTKLHIPTEKQQLVIFRKIQWYIKNVFVEKFNGYYDEMALAEIQMPPIYFDNDPQAVDKGDYYWDDFTINIFTKKHKTSKQILDTIIHEFIHHFMFIVFNDLPPSGDKDHPMLFWGLFIGYYNYNGYIIDY